jgi:hypothetical protein
MVGAQDQKTVQQWISRFYKSYQLKAHKKREGNLVYIKELYNIHLLNSYD